MIPRRPLNNAAARQQRLSRIKDPHVRELNAFAEALGKAHPDVPYFDPGGGGSKAAVLLLLSDPGAKGAQITNIVSVDNPDKTARNLLRMMGEAELDPRDTVNWNIVPWATTTPDLEIDAGASALRRLLLLLRGLQVVVAMGGRAKPGWSRVKHEYPRLHSLATWHPAQRGGVANEREIVACLREARRLAGLR